MSKKTAIATATAILSKADTDKLITSIKGRGAKLDNDIHQAALSSLDHHAKHGDVTLINRLIGTMPKSARTNALVAWALAMQPLLMKNPAKDAANPLVHNKSGEGEAFTVAKAIETPFWEFKAKEGVSVFSFDSYITSMTKGIDRALAEPTISDEQRAKLEATKAVLVAAPAVINSAVTE